MGLLSGFTRYQLVYDPNEKLDDTHDGYHVEGVRGFENKPGDAVHLEVDRSVTTTDRIDRSNKGGSTKVTWDAQNIGDSPTILQQINVRYASGAGSKTREFTRNNEWTHSRDAIQSANRLRDDWGGRARQNTWGADKAADFIRRGLGAYGAAFRQESWQNWDNFQMPWLPNNSWKAPNGTRVAPHTPIDAATGNPLDWDQ